MICSKCGYKSELHFQICPSCTFDVLKGIYHDPQKSSLKELTSIPTSRRLSEQTAFILAFFFGPLGMLYVDRFLRAFFVSVCYWLVCSQFVAVLGEVGDRVKAFVGFGLFGIHLFIFPIWALRRVRELNEAITPGKEVQVSEQTIKEAITQALSNHPSWQLLRTGILRSQIDIQRIDAFDNVGKFFPVFAVVAIIGSNTFIEISDYDYFQIYKDETGNWKAKGIKSSTR
jgi:hypothetical protein